MESFKPGDRVHLATARSGFYRHPYSKWAKEGRPATVESVDGSGMLLVRFDCARKPARPSDYILRVRPGDVDPLTGGAQ